MVNMEDSKKDTINKTRKMKVCIIGGGATGLCAARLLAEHSNNFDITLYEKDSKLGGTWYYKDTHEFKNDDTSTVHSSIYKNLRFFYEKNITCIF